MIQGNDQSLEWRSLLLQAALAEYQALRSEILQKFRHHLQIYSVVIGAITVMLGWVITKKAYDVLLVIPIFSTALTLRYIWEQSVIVMLGDYLRKMEKDVFPRLLENGPGGTVEAPFGMGWEQHFRDNFPNLPLYKMAILVLLVVIPMVPALLYSGAFILSALNVGNIPVTTELHLAVHVFAFVVYFPLGLYLIIKLWDS